MKKIILTMVAAVIGLALQTSLAVEGAGSPQKKLTDAEAFGKLPKLESVKISPNGKRFVALESFEGNTVLVTRSFVKGEEDQVYSISYPDGEFRYVEWATDERLVFVVRFATYVRGQKLRATRLLAINWDKTKPLNLVKRQVNKFGRTVYPVYQGNILSILKDDPKHILVSKSKNNQGYPEVFKVNIHNANRKLRLGARNKIVRWAIDDFGNILGGRTSDYQRTSEMVGFVYNGTGKGSYKTVYEYDNLIEDSFINYVGPTRDPNVIYAGAQHEGTEAIFKYNVHSKTFIGPVAHHKKVDISDVEFNDDRELISYSFDDKKPRTVYVDKVLKAYYIQLKRIFRGQMVNFVSHTWDRTQYIIEVSSDMNPGTYYLFNTKTNNLRKISDIAPQIDRSKLSAMKPISYKATDGLVIPGYLTLPKGVEAKNLPTIILPHGGPFVRDSWGYDYWSQFLAAQGYAVLQMNYRGSSNYNYDFSEKGKGEYAGKMITDINDGAKWMIEKGYTDPKRICIVGWSYGGYAALKAPLVDKNLYKCTVAGAAVADIGRQKRESNARAYYRRYIESSKESYAEMSPINYAKDYNLPLLMVHGKKDHQVNYAHSVDMVDALKSAGKDVRFVTLENETHYLDKEESRVIFLSEMEKFLAKHLK